MPQYWFRYGHLEGIVVKAGQLVSAGQKLAVVADPQDNGGWSPHLHFDCWIKDQPAGAYTKGMPYNKFEEQYTDPRMVMSKHQMLLPTGVPDSQVRWGFKHGEWAKYPTGNMFHPGWDYNWGVGPSGEVGKPVFAVASGVVQYAGKPGASWGGVVVIKVTIGEEDMGKIEELEAIVRNKDAEIRDLVADRDAKISQLNNQGTHIQNQDRELDILKERINLLEQQGTGSFIPVTQLYIKK